MKSSVGYWVCFGTRRDVLFKSRDVKIVQAAGSVFNTEGTDNGGVGGMKGYIYLSTCDFLVRLVQLVHECTCAQPSSYTITRHLMNVNP